MTVNYTEKALANLSPSMAQDWPMLQIEKAEGLYLHTTDGRKIMDFISGIGVCNLGHNHPKVLQAAYAQMEKVMHTTVGLVYHQSTVELTEVLSSVMPANMEMFFFGNCGTEAVDSAIKLARYTTSQQGIIAFTGGFHGRTYGAASVTGNAKYRKHYMPFVPGVYFADFPNPYRCPLGNTPEAAVEWSIGSIERLFKYIVSPEEVAAILIEPVQGAGGYLIPPDGFLQELRKICDQNGILLIFDEVQTGFGRTGEMFAAQTFGVNPDIMAIAKSIANGFPMSATVANREMMSKWPTSAHGTTFGGNPVACAAALAVQEVFAEEPILDHTKTMGKIFLDGLSALKEKHAFIGDVRGVGMMMGMEIIKPDGQKTPDGKTAMKILNAALEKGVLGYMAGLEGQVIRFLPPLITKEEEIHQVLEILEVCLANINED